MNCACWLRSGSIIRLSPTIWLSEIRQMLIQSTENYWSLKARLSEIRQTMKNPNWLLQMQQTKSQNPQYRWMISQYLLQMQR